MFKFKSAPPSAAKAAEIVAKLEAEDAATAAELERCIAEFGALVIAAEEDPTAGNLAAAERGRKAVDKARIATDDSKTKLAAARARHTEAVAAEEAQNTAARWDRVDVHAAERLKAAQDAEKAAASLWEAFQRMVVASEAIARERPVKIPGGGGQAFTESALTDSGQVAAPLRLHLLKTGFGWAASWPWDAGELPTLVTRISDANAYLTRLRREGRTDAA